MATPLLFAFVAASAVLAACGAGAPPDVRGAPWPEANALFRGDPLWQGGDGAYSVDLGGDRVLWLFGDSFVGATKDAASSYMVRNSVAIQTGRDPSRAFLRFYWRTVDDHPASFQPEQGPYWFWPCHGIRVADRLLLFYRRLYQDSPGMWGFRDLDFAAFLVQNPDDEPSAWVMTQAATPSAVDRDVMLGGAVVREGDQLYVYGNDVNQIPIGIFLARFDLARAIAGDLTAPEWWNGRGWGDRDGRQAVVGFGGTEYSVSFSERMGLYVMVQSAGAGATTLAIRTAPRLEGPWSELRDVLRPPESYYTDAFVYAGKGHPELLGADLVATYVPSSFDTLPPSIGDAYYNPFFARLTFP